MSPGRKIQFLLIASLTVISAAYVAPPHLQTPKRPLSANQLTIRERRADTRIFAPVVTTVQTISNDVLNGICGGLTALFSLLEVAGQAILTALISVVNAMSSALGAVLPQVTGPLGAVQGILTVANQALSNVTGVASTLACTITGGVGSFINSIGGVIINL